MDFAVLGGDARIVRMCHLLTADGHTVRCCGLDKAPGAAALSQQSTPETAVAGADCVVLPLPVRGGPGLLNTPLSDQELPLERVFGAVTPGQLVCAGMVDGETLALATARGLELRDYYRREELAVMNAVATAEGAIALLIRDTAITLWDARVLVLGFGRVGKLLAQRLRGLGARVSVSSRRCGDMAWCRALGYEALDTRTLEGRLADFDVVVNTIPARVLEEARLRELKTDALVLDLASRPGGTDFPAASRLGVRAVWALSLPGEVAPVSAGAIIRDTIYNIIKEQEDG